VNGTKACASTAGELLSKKRVRGRKGEPHSSKRVLGYKEKLL